MIYGGFYLGAAIRYDSPRVAAYLLDKSTVPKEQSDKILTLLRQYIK